MAAAFLSKEVQGISSPLKLFAELGCGDVDQAARSLGEGSAMQFGHAVFAHHVMDMRARGCDRRAISELRYDPRGQVTGRERHLLLSQFRTMRYVSRRRQGNNRASMW